MNAILLETSNVRLISAKSCSPNLLDYMTEYERKNLILSFGKSRQDHKMCAKF